MSFDIEKFCFDTPIYTVFPIEDPNCDEFRSLFFSSVEKDFEGYNPWQNTQSTFRIRRRLTYYDNQFKSQGGFAELIIECKRYHDEFRFYIIWNPKENFLYKIGQFPSVADFHISEVKQYKKVCPDEKLKELTRAIGLAANGVGIGSFVYLRRIFEYLIQEAYAKGNQEGKITEEQFVPSRMDDKIKLLKDYLPEFLVENSGMYSILSKGIHELDEKTCLAHFDSLRVGIEIILDEKLELLKKAEKTATAKKKLDEAKQKLK